MGERKRVLIVHSGNESLKYKGDESIGVKGIFWVSGPHKSGG